jgi:hypothetical protein
VKSAPKTQKESRYKKGIAIQKRIESSSDLLFPFPYFLLSALRWKAIHQFMPENMPEIMPAVFSMKIMPAFPFVLHCILALFLCQDVWYSPNYYAGIKIMPSST